MPRNGSGTYNLPSGNPVQPGTLIDANWANSTLNDIANELTDSLSRTGEGGMLAPFRLADGLQATPGIAWTNEPSTGFYRAGSGEMWAVVGGTQVFQYTANGAMSRFAAGAVTTPSIARMGDLNTGIYFPGADELGIATGGVARLTVDAAGAVNVPGNVSVGGTFAVTGGITFIGNASVGGTLGVTGATTLSSTLGVTGAATLSSTLAVTGGITATGGVTGNLTGNVTGNVSGNAGTVTNGVYTTGSYSDPSWLVSVAGSKVTGNISGNAATATTATNVSGGTASVTTLATSSTATVGGQLTVNSPIARIVDTSATLQLFKDSTPTKAARVSFNTAATDSVSLGVFNGSSWVEGLTVSSAGSVGVGTTNPAEKLSLFTAAGPSLGLRSTNYTYVIDTVDSTGSFRIGRNDGVAATRLAIDSSGNVGIGTSSPGYKLHVVADSGIAAGFDRGDGSPAIIDLRTSGTTRGYLGAAASTPFIVYNSTPTELMRIDSSGNLGVGVTPSAWYSTWKAIDFSGPAVISGGISGAYVMSNSYLNSSGQFVYKTSDTAAYYQQTSGLHVWYTAPSGTAGNAITFTTAMTLTSTGLGITENNNPTQALNIYRSGSTQTVMAAGNSNTGLNGTYFGVDTTGNGIINTTGAFATIFSNNGSERARITSGGYWKAQGNSTYIDLAGAYHEFAASSGTCVLKVENKNNVSTVQCLVSKLGSNSNDTSSYHYIAATGGADKLYIYGNGNVVNVNNSYGTLSDEKLKTDIVDASSQWDDMKAVRFRKFKMKDDPSGLMQLGVVAQELEQVSPGLVDEHPDYEQVEVTDDEGNATKTRQPTGTTTKSVKTSVLLMKAAVALQEAMARIEKLEADVAALKAA